jgi:hypothetical protein
MSNERKADRFLRIKLENKKLLLEARIENLKRIGMGGACPEMVMFYHTLKMSQVHYLKLWRPERINGTFRPNQPISWTEFGMTFGGDILMAITGKHTV